MNLRESGRQAGRQAGQRGKEIAESMQREFAFAHRLFPTTKDMDMAAAIVAYDRRRLADEPSYATFPELRGQIDRLLGEREGFRETAGDDEVLRAFHYSWWHFQWKHINAHHAARYDLCGVRGQCTNVFFPDGAEGVTISDNRDDVPVPWYEAHVPKFRLGPMPREWKWSPWQGGVSSSVLLDEEPGCSFPCDPHRLMPEECFNDVGEMVKFMQRYRDFWGPGNQLWIDRKLNGVMVEKANVRMAVRWPKAGTRAICITACSYIDPELNAFKESRLALLAKAKGETVDQCMDAIFSRGCDLRQKRLLELTEKEAARPGGATLWGAFQCVADTAVPFPARVCLAGEKTDPAREPNANWTLTQHAAVLTGNNRRGLYRSVQSMANPRPIIQETPKLVLGEGVAMRPEWQADIAAGRCALAPEVAPAKA